jgi:hypothetical protein
MVSAAVACLPTAVSLLLLEALFMQISVVSLALTWPCRHCFLRVLLYVSCCYKLSLSKHTGEGDTTLTFSGLRGCLYSRGKWVFPPLLWSFPLTATFTSSSAPDYWAVLLLLPVAMFVYSSRGRRVLSPLLCSFPPSTTLTSFPVPGGWAHERLPLEPLWHTWLVYLQFWEGFPSPILSALCATYIFPASLFFLLIITQFHFFPQVLVRLSRGLCYSGRELSVGVPCTGKLTLSASSLYCSTKYWNTGYISAVTSQL